MRHWPDTSQTLALLAIAIITWTLGYITLSDYVTFSSAPTRMAILFIGGQALGIALRLLNWPEMLGMIGFGVLYANLGQADFVGYTQLEAFFRWAFFMLSIVAVHFVFIYQGDK